MPSYYDIDEILAEDELIPCATNFDFALLGFLDPEYANFTYQEQRRKRNRNNSVASATPTTTPSSVALPSGHRIKMPLWSVDLWSKLSYARIGLPKQYGGKMRERLIADPSHIDMRTIIRSGSGGERFLLTGTRLVDLVNACNRRVQSETRKLTSRGRVSSREYKRRQEEARIVSEVHDEAQFLRAVLLQLYTGERLRRTLDWSLNSGMDDDVSHYTNRLTDTERKVFAAGAGAARALQDWKSSSSGGGTALTLRQSMKRVGVPLSLATGTTNTSALENADKSRVVTPDNVSNLARPSSKRQRAF
jgi:hypothetical protein